MPRVISVTGLGYVGLPLAIGFARAGFRVIGFDADASRIAELRSGIDRNCETKSEHLASEGLSFHAEADCLRSANFHIVAVPTPITASNQPDLGPLLSASRMIGERLKTDDTVVYESTVFPGATEDHCIPRLEVASGLRSGIDFNVGYSPERINPGDPSHSLETVVKVISGQNERALQLLDRVYSKVAKSGVHRAPNIRTAEASKIVENIQRDINIALVNELATVFHSLEIDTADVLKAASTKWNFAHFEPGLVGGHCISVDPYYMIHCAEALGLSPQLMAMARRTNNSMPTYLAQETMKRIVKSGLSKNPIITVLGMSYKENVRDIRNSKIPRIVAEFRRYGADVQLSDPVCDSEEVKKEYDLECVPLQDLKPADAVLLAVPHQQFIEHGWASIQGLLSNGRGLIVDLKSKLDLSFKPQGVELWRI
jgi:UDP-N-acetyl-D-glucosamine/UDP-N-acetyl-D-galactosamine dehydrogenase